MQRKNLIIFGSLLSILVLGVVAAIAFVIPMQDTGPGPRPPQPTSVSQEPVRAEPGDTIITLKWQPVQGAAGYFVFRDGSSAPLNPTPITATSYLDIGLSNGRTYTYTISVADGGGKPGKQLAETKVVPKSR